MRSTSATTLTAELTEATAERPRPRSISLVIGYALTTLLLGAGGLLMVPAIVFAGGPDAWATVALGQAFGIITAVFVGYGWALTGPAMIAAMNGSEQVAEFRKSLLGRLLIGLPSTVVSLSLLWWMFPDDKGLSGLSLVGTAAAGLSSNWVFVGISKPFALLWTETVPRSLATAVAIILLYSGTNIEAALSVQLCGMLTAVGIVSLRIKKLSGAASAVSATVGYEIPKLRFGVIISALRTQGHGMTTSLISVVYITVPLFIVGLIAPGALPVFALADKIQKQFMSLIAPIVSVAQGWVPNGGTRRRILKRSRQAMLVSVVLALVAFAGIFVTGPWLWGLLGSSQIEFDPTVGIVLAALCAAILLERLVSRACLIPLGGSRQLVYATTLGSIMGIALSLVLLPVMAAVGALIGVLVGLGLTIFVEAIAVFLLHRGAGPRHRMPTRRRPAR
ncbi:hypothetical protein LFT45_17310 [Arthrobacter sp. FW305-BF8]|uniref:hypothetical protein n=1 Tax=Arthrobacter sp. FW305-BF8 TaxID=2879617 RepID=UPI001F1AF626|nr:hypothetical protein [Arthrobacter sp. FW305-BF8]UKA53463.1 hypothetical protein LFT45_17310 [Arthrobacter sp. FW305-BF8]